MPGMWVTKTNTELHTDQFTCLIGCCGLQAPVRKTVKLVVPLEQSLPADLFLDMLDFLSLEHVLIVRLVSQYLAALTTQHVLEKVGLPQKSRSRSWGQVVVGTVADQGMVVPSSGAVRGARSQTLRPTSPPPPQPHPTPAPGLRVAKC